MQLPSWVTLKSLSSSSSLVMCVCVCVIRLFMFLVQFMTSSLSTRPSNCRLFYKIIIGGVTFTCAGGMLCLCFPKCQWNSVFCSLSSGARVNAKDNMWLTPLHRAVASRSEVGGHTRSHALLINTKLLTFVASRGCCKHSLSSE